MDELAAFILARVAEDHDLADQALHDPGAGGILGAHIRRCHTADAGRSVVVAGHELLLDPLACHNLNQGPEKVIAQCAAKRRLVAHVQSIDWAYEPAGEQTTCVRSSSCWLRPGGITPTTRCTGVPEQGQCRGVCSAGQNGGYVWTLRDRREQGRN